MNNKGMFYTNVDDYETKEDMMNDFIALRMYDMAKDQEIERLNNIIIELRKENINLIVDNMRLRKELNLHGGKLYISDIEVKKFGSDKE